MDRQISLITGLIREFSNLGYGKWFANIDKLHSDKSNLRILGLNKERFILIYDSVLYDDECGLILEALISSNINFVYITNFIELDLNDDDA